MAEGFTDAAAYWTAIAQVGRLAHEDAAGAAQALAVLCRREAATDALPLPFARLCVALGLDEACALCVAWQLYCEQAGVAVTPDGLLEKHRLLGGQDPDLLAELFCADNDRVVLYPMVHDFLAGRPPRLEGEAFFAPPPAGTLLHSGALLEELEHTLDTWLAADEPRPLVLALQGPAGSGRRFLLRTLAKRMGWPLVVLKGPERLDGTLLAAALYGGVVLVEDFPGWRDAAEKVAARLGLALCSLDPATQPALTAGDASLLLRPMPAPNATQRAEMLKALCAGLPFGHAPDWAVATAGGRLTVGRMARAEARLRAEALAAPNGRIAPDTFERVLQQCAQVPVSGTRPMAAAGSLDALVLPDEQKRLLAEICGFIRSRATVFDSWGFGQRMAYGRGISVLFYGAPGTGKTMAAAVMAAETGLPLYRVDLAQLISKYVGETQKNLGRVFDEAAESDCILFFDEADALFSRRGEGGDAQDKYANAEVAYLLQRTEQHDGVCVLATNLLSNFDEAFRRRIGFMLHFPLPTAAQRRLIWQGIFPPGAPLAAPDWELLAELELSGAGIKNCAVHAALLAALEDTEIGMGQLLRAAANEYAKNGKTLGIKAAHRLAAAEQGGVAI